jgi:hypothetical protein
MKNLLIAFCILAPLLAVGQTVGTNSVGTDEELRRKFVGVWTSDGVCLHGIATNTLDGKSISKGWVTGTNCNPRGVARYLESTWQIENGILITRITKSSDPDITPVGWTGRGRVSHITDGEMGVVPLNNPLGTTNVVKRLK